MDHLARLIDPITQFLGTDFGSNILRALGSAAAAVATLFAIALTVRNSGRRWWNFFRRRLRDDLKVVDAILTDRDSGVYEIDIKLRNLGSQPIVIRQIALQIHEALQLECTGGAVSKLVVTETYNVLLDPTDVPRLIEIPASQVIEPNKADRFLLIIDSVTNDTFYKFSIEAVCNEDRSSLKIGTFVLFVEDIFNIKRRPSTEQLRSFMKSGVICNDSAKIYLKQFA